jgi:membrane associated rhomboid family serine protease
MFIPYGDDIEKPHPPFATIFLMAVNGLVSLYEYRLLHEEPITGSRYRHFIEQWGLIPQELAQGKVMGLLSGMFLHADLAHLLGNLFTMWLFAWTIEIALGSLPFLVMYVSWGIAAGATHAALNWGSPIPCVGASGAIFGIVGAYFVTFGVSAEVKCLWNGGILTGWKFVKFKIPAGLYVFFWLLIPQFIGIMEAKTGPDAHAGVAWYAHAGGFAAGMLCMAVFGGDAMRKLRLNREGKWEIQSAAERAPNDAGGQPANPQSSLADDSGQFDGSTLCTYCRMALDESHKIDSTLYRCPNPECRRLTYVTGQPARMAGSQRR